MNDLSPMTSSLTAPASLAGRSAVAQRSDHIAPDCSGLNFFAIDRSLRDLLGLYMEAPLLAHLTGPTGHVVGVELVPEVLAMALGNLRPRRPNVELHLADPAVLGWPTQAPYDRVLVSADAATLSNALVRQVRPGGVLVGPVAGEMLRVERHGRYVFVPLLQRPPG